MTTITDHHIQNRDLRMGSKTELEAVTVVFPDTAGQEPLRLSLPAGCKNRAMYMAVASAAFPEADISFEFGNTSLAINASKEISWAEVIHGLKPQQRAQLAKEHGVTERMLDRIAAADASTEPRLDDFHFS